MVQYTSYVKRGVTVNTVYIVRALRRVLLALWQKRLHLVTGSGFSTDITHQSTPHSRCMRSSWSTQPSSPPRYPDLAPEDSFLFLTLEKEPAGMMMTPTKFKNTGEEGLQNSLPKTTLSGPSWGGWSGAKMDLNQWPGWKNLENTYNPNYNSFVFFKFWSLFFNALCTVCTSLWLFFHSGLFCWYGIYT